MPESSRRCYQTCVTAAESLKLKTCISETISVRGNAHQCMLWTSRTMFLQILPKEQLGALYESPWTCNALLRALQPLSRLYITRLLLVTAPVPTGDLPFPQNMPHSASQHYRSAPHPLDIPASSHRILLGKSKGGSIRAVQQLRGDKSTHELLCPSSLGVMIMLRISLHRACRQLAI